jgi:hypothetical protein
MHSCAGLGGLTAPMVEVRTPTSRPDARHVVVESQDYAADSERVSAVRTNHADGRVDCTVFPRTARASFSSAAAGHDAATYGGRISVTPGTAGVVGQANYRRPLIRDPELRRMYLVAERLGARMAWSASAVFAYAVLLLCQKGGQTLNSDTYYAALYASGTPDKTVTTAALTEYNGSGSQWVTANEVSSTGYSAGGAHVTPISLSQTTNVITFTSSGSPQWTGVSFTTYGTLVYDTSDSNEGLCYNYFGGEQLVTSATFSIAWNASGICTFSS